MSLKQKPDKPKSELVVLGAQIATNEHDLFRANDLHKLAIERGLATKHDEPAAFLRQKETKRLIEALKARTVNSQSPVIKAVSTGPMSLRGTYVNRYILLAYAAWLNGDVYLDAMIALDAMSAKHSDNQLSASEKYFRAERLFNEVVARGSKAGTELAACKYTIPAATEALDESAVGMQLQFPGFVPTPLLETVKEKRNRTRK